MIFARNFYYRILIVFSFERVFNLQNELSERYSGLSNVSAVCFKTQNGRTISSLRKFMKSPLHSGISIRGIFAFN